jgi:hypothetical protein
VNKVEFDDASKFTCADGIQMSLCHYSVALYGQTWYEKNFNARLKDVSKHESYSKAIKNFTDPAKKPLFIVAFKDFYAVHKQSLDALKDQFDRAKTYQEFFQELKKKYKSQFCDVTKHWLTEFVNNVLGANYLNDRWEIDMKTPNASNIEILSISPLATAPKYTRQDGGNRDRRDRRDPRDPRHQVIMGCDDL